VDDILNLIQARQDQADQEKRRRKRDADRREALVAACETVARWGGDSVVRPGSSPAGEEDEVMQLAWAVRDLAGATGRCGLAGRLEELAGEEGDPARRYALGLVVLAGREGKREELERRVNDAWTRPTVWRDVVAWIRQLPGILSDAVDPAVHHEGPKQVNLPVQTGRRKAKASRGQDVQVEGPAGEGLPEEVGTARAAALLGVSRDTVLEYRRKGLLPFRDLAPPGSSKPSYLFPLDAVVKLRTAYQTEEPAQDLPHEPRRRTVKGRRQFKHLIIDE
jgi:hypothetical protein